MKPYTNPVTYTEKVVKIMSEFGMIMEEDEANLENYLWNTGFQEIF